MIRLNFTDASPKNSTQQSVQQLSCVSGQSSRSGFSETHTLALPQCQGRARRVSRIGGAVGRLLRQMTHETAGDLIYDFHSKEERRCM